MSGLSPVGSALSTSNLSNVGESLLTSGRAPNATPAAAAPAAGTSITSYTSELLTLKQQDTAELLYASFLSPSAGLANADAVLGQAAQLLGAPGALPSSQATTSATPSSSGTSSNSGATASTDPVSSIPSVGSLEAASTAAAQAALSAYAAAPSGSSILDFQA